MYQSFPGWGKPLWIIIRKQGSDNGINVQQTHLILCVYTHFKGLLTSQFAWYKTSVLAALTCDLICNIYVLYSCRWF